MKAYVHRPPHTRQIERATLRTGRKPIAPVRRYGDLNRPSVFTRALCALAWMLGLSPDR